MIEKDEVEKIEEDEIDELEYRATNVKLFLEDWIFFAFGVVAILICVAASVYFGGQS